MFRESDAGRPQPPSSTNDPDRDVPTLRTPTEVAVVRYKVGVSADELLYRFSVGDHIGALDAAQALFDEEPVPIVSLPSNVARAMPLTHREEYVLSFVDGRRALDYIVNECGLAMLDALAAVCGLLDKRVIALR